MIPQQHNKLGRLVLEEYLTWLHMKPCCFCGERQGIQAHHVETRGMGGARRNDATCIPVCVQCHQRCEGITVAECDDAGCFKCRLPPIDKTQQWVNVGIYLSTWMLERATRGDQVVPF